MNSQPSPPSPSRTPVLTALVVLLALAAGGLLAAYPRTLHFSFAYSAYDVGMHLQALWKFSRLDGLLNTIRGLPYWGDHPWIGYALLAPVYRIWPTATVLYAYQGLGLAAGGLAVWGIARRRLANRVVALVPVVLYLCYPGLIYTAQENFHPEAIGSTWLLVVLWAEETGRRRMFWLAVALAIATKEDIALYLIGFAVWIFLRGDRRRAVVLAGVCAVYFVVAMKVLLPWFNGVGFFRASGGYWFSALAANVMNPSWYAEVFARPVARTYAWDLLWPVAFLPLLSPVTLFLLAVPAFVVNNLAGAYLVSVHYHYMYGIIPGVFMATVEALATLEGLARRWLHRRGSGAPSERSSSGSSSSRRSACRSASRSARCRTSSWRATCAPTTPRRSASSTRRSRASGRRRRSPRRTTSSRSWPTGAGSSCSPTPGR
ncbi:MAG: DUF2079 domain-containing protein [Pseudomonadota bacterium]|nr:DUF2079 domain-containing protein [Pseudomonadota bacterium]